MDKILRNPKYTGHMVYGRTRGRSQGKARNAPRNEWIWSPEPTHPAIITLETWEAAQLVGTENATSRDDSDSEGVTVANRDRYYELRSRVRCRLCNRRMCGNSLTKQPSPHRPEGVTHVYYLCPHDKTNPRHHAAHPDHPTVRVREDALMTVITEFFTQRVFGPDRAAMLAAQLPATAADQARQLEKEAARLRKQLTRLDKADASAFKELEETEDSNTPAVLAYRRRIRERFIDREEERTRLTEQLAKITAQQGRTTTNDTTLPVRLRLRPSSCPLTWSFPLIFTILSALTQGPAVTLADRRHPLRRSSGSPPNRPCHSEVAGQGTACRLWSGHSRRYASGKLRTSVKVSGTEEP